MNSMVNQCQSWSRRSVKFEDPKGLVRPEDLSAGNAPAETPGAAQPLCLRQIPFAAPLFLGHPLLLGNVHPRADIACNHAFLVNRGANLAKRPDLAVRPDDPVLVVIDLAFCKDLLRFSQNALAVFRMHVSHE